MAGFRDEHHDFNRPEQVDEAFRVLASCEFDWNPDQELNRVPEQSQRNRKLEVALRCYRFMYNTSAMITSVFSGLEFAGGNTASGVALGALTLTQVVAARTCEPLISGYGR